MKYTVKIVGQTKQYQGKYGPGISYNLQLVDEQGVETWCDLAQSAKTPAPTIGQVLEGTMTTDQYGTKFKKDQRPFTKGGYRDNPESRREIIRMNSQTNAVNFCIARKELEVDDVLEVAEKFARWSGNGLFDVQDAKEAMNQLPQPQKDYSKPPVQQTTVTANEPDYPDNNPDINPEDIPF